MKKLLLASAVAALSIVTAQAAPTIYGKAFLTLDVQDGNKNSDSKDSRSQLNSNASRLGVKGSENLTANTDLIYQLEYRLDVDNNGDSNWGSRDTYLGLSHKQYGTAVAGRLTAIDDYVNYASIAQGGVVGGDNVLASFDAPRANNAFAYFSPEREGIQFMGMYVMDETKGKNGEGNDTFYGDAFGVGVKYEPANAPFKAGVTYIKASQYGMTDVASDIPVNKKDKNGVEQLVGYRGADAQAIRVSGAYAVSPALTVGALYQNTNLGKATIGKTLKKENAFAVSANYKVAQTPWTAYGQVDVVDNAGGDKNAEKQRLVVGGQYAFNKNTTGHVYSAYLRNKTTDATNAKVNADAYGVGAGLEYKF